MKRIQIDRYARFLLRSCEGGREGGGGASREERERRRRCVCGADEATINLR